MFKKLKIPKFVFTTQESMNSRIEDAVIQALQGHLKAHGFGNNKSPEEISALEREIQLFIENKKIHSPELKEILLSMNSVPQVDLRRDQLNILQDVIWSKYKADPLITSIIDNFTDYVYGRGLTIFSPDPNVNKFINYTRNLNQCHRRELEIIRSSFIDGEYYTQLLTGRNGFSLLRKVHPKSIISMETSPDDIEAMYSYLVASVPNEEDGYSKEANQKRIQDFNYAQWSTNKEFDYTKSKHHKEIMANKRALISQLRFNDLDNLNGLPPLKGVLKATKLFENFIKDRMMLNHERAKVVWIKTILGNRDDGGQSLRSPQGGVILQETTNVKYRTESAKLDSNEAKEDALTLLYWVASMVRFPINILNMRTDQSVYGAIKKSDQPFNKMIEGYQFIYENYFENYYRKAIEQNIAFAPSAYKLPKQVNVPAYDDDVLFRGNDFLMKEGVNEKSVKEFKDIIKKGSMTVPVETKDIPITTVLPGLILQDPEELAKVLKIHQEMGIVSISTIASKVGYNPYKEKYLVMGDFIENLQKAKITTDVIGQPELPEDGKPATQKSASPATDKNENRTDLKGTGIKKPRE